MPARWPDTAEKVLAEARVTRAQVAPARPQGVATRAAARAATAARAEKLAQAKAGAAARAVAPGKAEVRAKTVLPLLVKAEPRGAAETMRREAARWEATLGTAANPEVAENRAPPEHSEEVDLQVLRGLAAPQAPGGSRQMR
jgi:hypothetical protein